MHRVTMMGRIYRGCMRVVVYLGNDVAQLPRPAASGPVAHPHRYDLHELDARLSASAMDSHELFRLAISVGSGLFRSFSRPLVTSSPSWAPSSKKGLSQQPS